METIRINQGGKMYGIKSIRPVGGHVIQVVFADGIPESFGDIQVYTSGGIQCADLPGYSTVYRQDGDTVYLSDDGSVHQPPGDPGGQPTEPYVPTLGELQGAKKAEVAAACERVIYRGVSVTLGDGKTEHFSLTEHDQLNLFGKQAQLAAGAGLLEYHADGQPCRYYSAADMQTIIQEAMWHVSYHTTYCNALNMWIAGCQENEEVEEIFYGADVPGEYRSEVLNAYLLQIATIAGGSGDGEAS
ncbi:acyl carrier protein [Clostridiaceae bacterium]|nr:acyl carrier protein [Clostridiaceae bacterium]RKI12078.1 acyl carrier protein [bacterium 1XD21-70]